MELELPKLKGLLAGILLLFPFQNIVAQSQPPALPAIIPPSPNAAELGRYATLDIGLQTGSLNYEIPLFNISADGVNIPIGIQYSASGIRVDQMSSICGMGWVLNAGGVVTRSINGFQDEVSTRSSLPANWSLMDASFIGYLRTVTAQTSPNGMDTEPDEFVYNFNGYHGKFVLDGDKQPVLMPHSNLKVELFYSGSNYSGIKVGTPDGCVYRFDGQELSYLSTIHYGDNANLTKNRQECQNE